MQEQAPELAPVFEEPYPKWTGPKSQGVLRAIHGSVAAGLPKVVKEALSRIESMEDFERRVEKRFRAQFTEYVKRVRRQFGYKERLMTQRHAEWTALGSPCRLNSYSITYRVTGVKEEFAHVIHANATGGRTARSPVCPSKRS
jgi:hypothetical protein